MLQYVVLLVCVIGISSDVTVEDIDTNLVTELRDDVNLDLSTDSEYEDLRAELLASHTVLAKLAEKELDKTNKIKEKKHKKHKVVASRRSLSNTPCWTLGGICINAKLCVGDNYLTEIPGCKDKAKVCCFGWNKFNVRDMSDKGFKNLAMPWSSLQTMFGGGGGVIEIDTAQGQARLRKRSKKKRVDSKKHIHSSEIADDETKVRRNNEELLKSSTEHVNPLAIIIREKK